MATGIQVENVSKCFEDFQALKDVSITVSKVVVAVGGLTRIGQYVSLAAGVKKGLDVFVRRLQATR